MPLDSEKDIRQLWREQPRTPDPLPIDEMRLKAEQFRSRRGRWKMIGSMVVVVAMIVGTVEAFWPGQGIVERTGDLLTVAAFLYIGYQYRKYARQSAPENPTAMNYAAVYRRQIVFERDLARQGARYLWPFVPGVTLSLLGGSVGHWSLIRSIGIVAFGVTLFLVIAWVYARTARRLQRELEALD